MTTTMPARPRILVIDDDAAIRAMLQDALDDTDCTVMEAASGEAGLAAFPSFQPDVILLDARMPGMDGFTACTLIRAMPDGATVPILIITALDDTTAIDRAFAAGATDFVSKPFRLNVLQHRVRRLAEAYQAQALLHVRDRAIAATTTGVLITDARQADHPIISVNPAFEQLTGYAADELLGRNCRLLQGPQTDPETVRILRAAVTAGQACHAEILNYRKDGTSFWNDLTITPIRDAHDRLTYFVGIQEDITERKQMEQSLRASEERFRLLFEHSPDAIWLLDPQTAPWTVVDCNPAACQMHGYAREELLGQRSTLVTFDPEDPNRLRRNVELIEQLRRNGHVRSENVHRRKDGTVFPIEYTNTLVVIDGRELVLGIDRDVTARKQAEELRRSEEQFRLLFEHSPDAILLLDPHDPSGAWPIVDCNEVACRMNGYGRNELIGQSIGFLDPQPMPADGAHQILELLRRTGRLHGESFHLRKDHTVFPIEYAAVLIQVGQRELVLSIDRDITERKEAEELRRREEQFRLLFEHSPDAILLFDPNDSSGLWPIVDCNQVACSLYAYPRNEMIGLSLHTLEPPADRQNLASMLSTGWRAGIERGEGRGQRKDGSVFPVEYSSSLVTLDGRELVLGIDRDITERKRVEEVLRRMTERLRQMQAIAQEVQVVQPSPVSGTTLHRVRMLISCRRAGLVLIDDAGGTATVLAVDIEGQVLLKSGDPAPQEVLAMRPQLRAGNVVHLDNIARLKSRAPEVQALQAEGIQEMLLVPLLTHGSLIGALALGTDRPGTFDEDNIVVAREVADLLAVTLHNTQLYDREQQARQIAEALQAASLALTESLELPVVLHQLLEHLGRLLPYDSANVMLLDDEGCFVIAGGRGYPDGESAGHFPVARFDPRTNALLSMMLKDQRTVLVPDTAAEPAWEHLTAGKHVRAWLGVPLVTAGKLIGIYSVDASTPNFFTKQHVAVAEAFAPHAALAVENGRLFVALATSRERLHRLSQQLLQVQETERRSLARELHDQVGQMLTALKMNLQMVMRSDKDAHLGDSIDLANQTLALVRDLSFELRPPMLDDFGLASALRWYLDREARRAGYAAQLMAEELEGRLSPGLESTCFRIVQEALTNVTRHAGASEVVVEMRQERHQLLLIVRDNGVGFDVATAQEGARRGNSLGLLSMRERAELAGGTLVIQPGSNGGTLVQASFPFAVPSYGGMRV